MSGVTKHIFEHDIIEICEMWNKQLKTIEKLLPKDYSKEDIISLLKHFYPHEWDSVQAKYEYYTIKDKHSKRIKGKTRYNMNAPDKLIEQCQEFKKMSSPSRKKEYFNNYNQEIINQEYQKLERKRKPKIQRIDEKIRQAKIKTQQVTPEFLDKLIGLYKRKSTTQNDRMYILIELKKYYNSKIIQFFFKLNDTEINKQLRETAFYHLQSFNYQPRLRRQKYMQIHTKNKNRKEYLKKIYAFQKTEIPFNPDELDYRINNSVEQQLKDFDYFISHSSKDSRTVQELITYLNSKGKNVYCDWISDSDYLKRNLLRKATLKVIEKRLEQSKAILFVCSSNSLTSVWCRYELNYFFETGKPIYQVDISEIENGNYIITDLNDTSFYDRNYKSLELFN